MPCVRKTADEPAKPDEIEHPDFNWTRAGSTTSPIWAAIRLSSSCPRAKSFRLSSPMPSATAAADLG